MSNNKWKVIIAIILVCGAGFYAWSSYSKMVPSAEINNNLAAQKERANRPEGERSERREPTPEERQERMQEMQKNLGLTEEQMQKMEQARAANQGDWRNMREQMDQILTPEQKEKMRASMQSRMDARDAKTKAALSPAEFEAYRARREQRMASRRSGQGSQGQSTPTAAGAPSGAR